MHDNKPARGQYSTANSWIENDTQSGDSGLRTAIGCPVDSGWPAGQRQHPSTGIFNTLDSIMTLLGNLQAELAVLTTQVDALG
jgi:hypothetical protein